MKTTFERIKKQTVAYSVPEDWLQIKTIDMHTGGEPLRVIIDGFPELEGNSVLDYRRFCKENYDHLRTALLFEPRGHSDMYGCVLVPPNDSEGDFGILFLHNEGYSTMCGHAIIAISTLAVQLKWIDVQEGENVLKIDAPCGRITSFVATEKGKVQHVCFHCVPSFVVGLDKKVKTKSFGSISYDLAYGGAFYAYVELLKNDLGFDLSTSSYQKIVQAGMEIKKAVIAQNKEIKHPFEEDLSFLYGTIFIDKSETKDIHSRNVCVFAEGEVDRCPTGSGVSGRMAIHHQRKELKLGESLKIESITGSIFKGSVVSELEYGPYRAVIPQVEGTANVIGIHTFVIDPDDPMKNGFLLR